MFFRGPGVPGVLRAANARLRGLLAERGAEIAVLREQLAALQAQVEGLAAQDVMEFIRCSIEFCCSFVFSSGGEPSGSLFMVGRTRRSGWLGGDD